MLAGTVFGLLVLGCISDCQLCMALAASLVLSCSFFLVHGHLDGVVFVTLRPCTFRFQPRVLTLCLQHPSPCHPHHFCHWIPHWIPHHHHSSVVWHVPLVTGLPGYFQPIAHGHNPAAISSPTVAPFNRALDSVSFCILFSFYDSSFVDPVVL
ncbi:hypothetical protein EDD16DRAFT_1593800 [Pisolithus croceorrhizus]|nr:hypothetical protein EDD16DRAFT_1593800 [Pisolithus croceorrhizus]